MSSAFGALVKKDLRLFLGDRRAVMISFVVPLALASLMGMVFGGSGGSDASGIDVVVVDQDHSPVSQEIVQALGADKTVALKSMAEDAARAQVRAGKASVALVLPKGFGDQAQRSFFVGRDKPQLELLYDPSHTAELAMVRGILTEKVMQTVSRRVFSADNGQKLIDDALAKVDQSKLTGDDQHALRDMLTSVRRWEQTEAKKPAAQRSGPAGGLSMPYTTKEEAITSGTDTKYNAYTHSFAGMGVQFVLFAGIEAAVGILTERQRGLWRRLRAAPLSRGTLLGAKAVSGTIISFGVMIALFLSGIVLFHITIDGSLLGFLLVLAAFGLMSATFGLLVAALGKTPQAARGLSILAVLIMVMLGGAWFPTFLFPPTMQKLTLVMPTRWAIDGIDAMTWRGLGLSHAIAPTAILVGCALLFGLIAVNRFRWDVD